MDKTINTRVKLKKDTQSNWTTKNPVLLDGEAIISKDGSDLHMKVGDGSTTYTNLPVLATTAGASKLQTARTIALGTAAEGISSPFDGSGDVIIPVTSVKEAYLEWGGKDNEDYATPLDAALIPSLGANRLSHMSASNIAVEYSKDSGSNWTHDIMELMDPSTIQAIVNSGGSPNSYEFKIGNASSGVTTDYKLRITLTAQEDELYFVAQKVAIWVNTNGATGGNVTIEGAHCGSDTTFTTIKSDVSCTGDPGVNVIQLANIKFGGSDSDTSNYRKLRFTFGITGLDSSSSNAYKVSHIEMFGTETYTLPSNMAKYNHPYIVSANQTVSFPTNIVVNGGTGTVIGIASKATEDENGDNIVNTYAKKSFFSGSTKTVTAGTGLIATETAVSDDEYGQVSCEISLDDSTTFVLNGKW